MTSTRHFSFGNLTLSLSFCGEDPVITISGGQKPHIGCCVLAIPRPSLTGNGEMSVTSSVLNVTGHYDDALCRPAAEYAAIRTGHCAVCFGGFHTDGMTAENIREVVRAIKTMLPELFL
jgi:hypothetical protein